jgi:hypothetical protein
VAAATLIRQPPRLARRNPFAGDRDITPRCASPPATASDRRRTCMTAVRMTQDDKLPGTPITRMTDREIAALKSACRRDRRPSIRRAGTAHSSSGRRVGTPQIYPIRITFTRRAVVEHPPNAAASVARPATTGTPMPVSPSRCRSRASTCRCWDGAARLVHQHGGGHKDPPADLRAAVEGAYACHGQGGSTRCASRRRR